MRFINKISELQTYIIGITVFFVITAFLPILNNVYFLPKLVILQFGAVLLFFTETVKIMILKKKKYFTWIDVVFLGFFLCNVLATIFSKAQVISFLGLYQNEGMNLLYLPSFLIMASVFHKLEAKQKDQVLHFIIGGTLLASLYTVIHYQIYRNEFGIIDRPNGLDGHPIWSSGTIGFGLLLTLFSPFSYIKNSLLKRVSKCIALFIYGFSLYYLFSSTALVSLLSALIGYWVIFILKIHKKISLKKIVFIVISFILLLLVFFRFSYIKSYSIERRITELKTSIQLYKNQYVDSQDKIKFILFGHGQNTTGFYYIQYKDPKNINDKEWLINLTQLHNQFLELFFTIGLPGVIIWFFLFITSLILSVRKNDHLTFILLLYLFFWQQLYVLLPSGLLFTFIILTKNQNAKPLIFSHSILTRFLLPILFIFISIFIIYTSFTIVYADYLYSQNYFKKAISMNPYNDEYIRGYTTRLHQELIRCQPSKLDPNIKGCLPFNMKQSAREEFELLKKAIFINPLNASNWNGYGASAFVLSFLEPENKIFYRTISLKADIQAYTLNPTEAAYADGVGLAYLDMQDYKNAEKFLQIALRLQPKSPQIIKHLIEVYRQTGNQKGQQNLELLLHE